METPILAYIKEGSLLDGKNEARRMRYKSVHSVIYDGILYRRGSSMLLLKYIDGDECNYILREVHEGICDLIGELPKVKGGVKYAVIAVYYFTKWAEAEPLTTITTKKLKNFVYRAIVCHKEMKEFCEQLGIHKSFSVVSHPQSNGQTEAVNKIIKHTLKAKLEEKKGTWSDELLRVLWSYNTTP
ncbi:uncharacterized protein LOC141685954 [Apium graveolens]|uniref:uncharacterized protein LOC141685954 n=1 Tax=Apium graveolens TaxID=4045 RepID=UPI003D79DEA1